MKYFFLAVIALFLALFGIAKHDAKKARENELKAKAEASKANTEKDLASASVSMLSAVSKALMELENLDDGMEKGKDSASFPSGMLETEEDAKDVAISLASERQTIIDSRLSIRDSFEENSAANSTRVVSGSSSTESHLLAEPASQQNPQQKSNASSISNLFQFGSARTRNASERIEAQNLGNYTSVKETSVKSRLQSLQEKTPPKAGKEKTEEKEAPKTPTAPRIIGISSTSAKALDPETKLSEAEKETSQMQMQRIRKLRGI